MNRDLGMSTVPSRDSGIIAWEPPLRRIVIGGIVIILAAALLGWLGVRTSTVSARENGFSVEVTHATVSRAGLATPFSIVVTSDGPALPGQVTLRVTSDYLALFDDNGMEPLPTASYNDPEWTRWTFDVPAGARRLRVDLDGRLEPAVQLGQPGTVALDIGGEEQVSVDFRTWVAP